MNALLKLLTPVRPGMPWDEVLTAARINAIQTLLLQLARGDNVSRGNNILLRRFEDSFTISARGGGTVATAAADYRFFQIIDATERGGDGSVTARKVRVVASTIDYAMPSDMTALDNPIFTLAVSGDGEIYAQLDFDVETGERTNPQILAATTTPPSDEYAKTLLLGGYSVPTDDAAPIAVNNVEYGPLRTSTCRDWFSNPVTFGFAWQPPIVEP